MKNDSEYEEVTEKPGRNALARPNLKLGQAWIFLALARLDP